MDNPKPSFPIALWKQIFPQSDLPSDPEEMTMAIEDY
jgi:hypothetical protein